MCDSIFLIECWMAGSAFWISVSFSSMDSSGSFSVAMVVIMTACMLSTTKRSLLIDGLATR